MVFPGAKQDTRGHEQPCTVTSLPPCLLTQSQPSPKVRPDPREETGGSNQAEVLGQAQESLRSQSTLAELQQGGVSACPGQRPREEEGKGRAEVRPEVGKERVNTVVVCWSGRPPLHFP